MHRAVQRSHFAATKLMRQTSSQQRQATMTNLKTTAVAATTTGTTTQDRGTCNLSFADMQYARKLLGQKEAFIIDCDGVIYHKDLLPGAKDFVSFLKDTGKRFVFLTNSSDKSLKKMLVKFENLGLTGLSENNFYTSSMATANFLRRQKQGGRAWVIGSDCLKTEIENMGTKVVDTVTAEMSTPDFVVVGESATKDLYNFELVEEAVKFVRRGARLIGTNEDVADRIGNEMIPGTGALILPIEAASGRKAYFIGKPNPLMVSSALERLQRTGSPISPSSAVVVGDRMNTDIRAGVEAGVDTVLVLSGVTSLNEVENFAYRPSTILSGVGDIAAIVASTSDADRELARELYPDEAVEQSQDEK